VSGLRGFELEEEDDVCRLDGVPANCIQRRRSRVSGDVEMERGGEREGKQERDGEGRTPAPAFFQLATLSISASL